MAEQVKDYYGILEIEQEATDKEIKNAYRKLSKVYHPDVSKLENAADLFDKLHEAYTVLSNPDTRKEYDEFVKSMKEGKGVTFQELYSKFHFDRPGAHAPIKGDDLEMNIHFLVSEVRQGLQKEINFDRYDNCEDCEGHGYYRESTKICKECEGKGYSLANADTPFGDLKTESICDTCKGVGYTDVKECTLCKGVGKVNKLVTVTFPLPKETTNGFRITLRGHGDAGLNGGKNGDLHVVLTQDPKDPFRIENDYDATFRLDVPFLTSLTGGRISVQLPSSETAKIPIKRGTQTGHQIVLPDEGLYNPRNGFYGNITAVVNILVPKHLPEDKVLKLIELLS